MKQRWLLFAGLGLLTLLAIYVFTDPKSSVKSPEKSSELVTIRDLAGRDVALSRHIQRIVLLRSKDIYELAPLLGDELPQKLIAWGSDLETDDREAYEKFTTKFPALKQLPNTGSVYNDALNIEQLVNLAPDLIIADKFLIERGYKYVPKLAEAGLPVVYLNGSNDPLTGSQQGITLLGKILGKEQRANDIVTYVNAQFDRVLSRLKASKKPAPTVYLEQGSMGPATYGATYGGIGNPRQYTSWGMVLHQLRVTNIAEGVVAKQEPISPEYLLKADPDVIVITGQNWTSTAGSMRLGYYAIRVESEKLLRHFTQRPGWPELKAVKNRRVYSVFHNTAVITCFSAVQALAKFVYPSEFADLRPDENLREFYRRFMPIDYSGTWMVAL